MNSLTIGTKFYLSSDETQLKHYNAAQSLSHIFTLSSQKFNKLKAKIDSGEHALMSMYASGTEARHFLEFAMLGVVASKKLTGRQASRIAYLCDGDLSRAVKDKRVSRTFERSSVSKGNMFETHQMGITNCTNEQRAKLISRKVLKLPKKIR